MLFFNIQNHKFDLYKPHHQSWLHLVFHKDIVRFFEVAGSENPPLALLRVYEKEGI